MEVTLIVADTNLIAGMYAADAQITQWAEDLWYSLLTFDQKVLKQFSAIAISPEEFISG